MNDIVRLPIDAKCGDNDVFHEGNHNSIGNPHPQNVNIRDMIRIPPKPASDSYYKLCKICLKRQDSYALIKLNISRFDNYSAIENQYIDLRLRVACQGSLGSGTRNTYLAITDSKGISKTLISAVITKDDSTGYEVELYFRNLMEASGATFYVQKIIEKTNTNVNTIDYFDDSTYVSALPSGTAINSKKFDIVMLQVFYDCSSTNWTTGTSYTVGTQVNSNGNVYTCTTGGTSGATAPTGTGTGISDGVCVWDYVKTIAWKVQDMNSVDASSTYGTPIWDTDGVRFPDGSIMLNSTTNIISVSTKYVSYNVLPHLPVIQYINFPTLRKVCFFDYSTGQRNTTLSNKMALYITAQVLS